MSTEDQMMEHIERVLDEARARWHGVFTEEQLERHLDFVRMHVVVHPVARRYVSRTLEWQPQVTTEDSREAETQPLPRVKKGKVSGGV